MQAKGGHDRLTQFHFLECKRRLRNRRWQLSLPAKQTQIPTLVAGWCLGIFFGRFRERNFLIPDFLTDFVQLLNSPGLRRLIGGLGKLEKDLTGSQLGPIQFRFVLLEILFDLFRTDGLANVSLPREGESQFAIQTLGGITDFF